MSNYPAQERAWPGCLLSSIAHAVSMSRFAELAHEQSWDGSNYSVQDSCGSRGTISFLGKMFVGVFFYAPSERNPFRSGKVELDRYFVGIPPSLRELAESEALQYVLEEFEGEVRPVITTAFWGDGSSHCIASTDLWDDLLSHGACLVQEAFLPVSEALAAWRARRELNDEQIEIVEDVYRRKLSVPDRIVQLPETQKRSLMRACPDDDAWSQTVTSFYEIGVVL